MPTSATTVSTAAGSVLLQTRSGGIVTLTLNRPEQYNALSSSLIAALQAAVDELSGDPTVRVVIIAGAGKAFCAGHDLKEMRTQGDPKFAEAMFAKFSKLMMSLTRMPQPVIARVHGFAFAAGCQLVAQCDLAVAASGAQFATSGVKFGLFCNTPGVALTRNVSRKAAMEMLLTGDAIDAPTALARGLLNRVVATDALDSEIERLAQSIVDKTPITVASGKRTFYEQLDAPLEDAYSIATEAMARSITTEDAAEGIDAFAAKRKPEWKGR